MKLSLKVSNLLPRLITTRLDPKGQLIQVEDLGFWKFCEAVSKSLQVSHIQQIDLNLDRVSADVVELEYQFFKNKTSTASWLLERDGRLLKGAIITWAVCAGYGGFAVFPSEGDTSRHLTSLVCKRTASDLGNDSWIFSVS